MSTQEKRIKLAEAMGITLHNRWDPFTDANDDYAVLEWLREKNDSPHEYLISQLDYGTRRYKWDYKIGDYARAALKELK